jgi:hypothetical protein
VKRSPLKRKTELRRTSKPKPRKPVSPASPAQRNKCAAYGSCIVCGRQPEWDGIPLDPMHLIDRSLCADPSNDPLRVVPGCRLCHSAYDDGKLDLLPFLEPGWRAELAEAVRLYGLIPTLQRVTNERWSPDASG